MEDGEGTYTNSNGDMYVGESKDSKRHGEGTYYFVGENGAIEVGEHKNGEPWDITRYNKKGTILGKFVDGIYIRESPFRIDENGKKYDDILLKEFSLRTKRIGIRRGFKTN